jgi:hypothetical protein
MVPAGRLLGRPERLSRIRSSSARQSAYVAEALARVANDLSEPAAIVPMPPANVTVRQSAKPSEATSAPPHSRNLTDLQIQAGPWQPTTAATAAALARINASTVVSALAYANRTANTTETAKATCCSFYFIHPRVHAG